VHVVTLPGLKPPGSCSSSSMILQAVLQLQRCLRTAHYCMKFQMQLPSALSCNSANLRLSTTFTQTSQCDLPIPCVCNAAVAAFSI
jgi:hypothetical protein